MNRRFHRPTEEQLKIEIGSKVYHEKWGYGEVKDEWGSWHSCRGCYAPVDRTWNFCPHCKNSLEVTLNSTGNDIVDVEFEDDGKIRSINKLWLQPDRRTFDPVIFMSDVKTTPAFECQLEPR